jgi:hypothetical protein
MLAKFKGMQRLAPVPGSGAPFAVSHPRLQALHRYWGEQRGDAKFAPKDSFDFKSLRPWLGHIALVDAEREPIELRFRLYGTYLVRLTGADHTGKRLDQCLHPDSIGCGPDSYLECVRSASPIAHAERYQMTSGSTAIAEQLLLPCSSTRTEVDVVVSALYVEAEPVSVA